MINDNVSNECISIFPLRKSNVVFLFSQRVQILKIEYKYGQYFTPLSQSDCRYFFVLAIMNDILQARTLAHNLRSQTDFARSFVNTSRFGLNSLRYFALEVWSIVPSDIKNASNSHI